MSPWGSGQCRTNGLTSTRCPLTCQRARNNYPRGPPPPSRGPRTRRPDRRGRRGACIPPPPRRGPGTPPALPPRPEIHARRQLNLEERRLTRLFPSEPHCVLNSFDTGTNTVRIPEVRPSQENAEAGHKYLHRRGNLLSRRHCPVLWVRCEGGPVFQDIEGARSSQRSVQHLELHPAARQLSRQGYTRGMRKRTTR